MDRREALKTSSLLLGYSISFGTVAAVMNGCKAETVLNWTPVNLDKDQAILVSEISELIIPKTKTPGAKDAMVDRFIDAILDCYPMERKQEYLASLSSFDEKSMASFNKPFVQCNPDQKKDIMDQMVEESQVTKGWHIFNRIKEWTVVGYCTSEIGATQHLVWDPVPGGHYQGCIPLSEIGGTSAL
jgi:hypothetical protein